MEILGYLPEKRRMFMRNLFGVLFAVLIAVPAFLAQTKEPIHGGPAAKHILVVPDQVKWGAPPKGWLAVRRPSRREARCATRYSKEGR
jgi:hypothetical protein